MSLLTKILNIIAGIFSWLPTFGRDFRTQRRENEEYRRETTEKVLHTCDELTMRQAELYKEVTQLKLADQNKTIVIEELTTENKKLKAESEKNSAKIEKLTAENAEFKTKIEVLTTENQKLTAQNEKLSAQFEALSNELTKTKRIAKTAKTK